MTLERPNSSVAATGEPWTHTEIEVTVAAYFSMLEMHISGQHFEKSPFVHRLFEALPVRSARAIEAKFQNISAVLDEVGLDWIDGYKPLSHYQVALRDAVLGRVEGPHGIRDALEAYESSGLVAPNVQVQATEDVVVPVPKVGRSSRRRSSVVITGGRQSGLRDFRARMLGEAGERWVVKLERESLHRAGRDDLAKKVQWVSHEIGDGLGYDIASFRGTGSPRLIEVKTTNLGPGTPFFITRWELNVSRQREDCYSLYRVHGFARDPRIYVLDGNVELQANLAPVVFLGTPKG